MTFRDEYFEFEAEEQRLEEKCQEIAEEAAQLDDDNPRKQALIAEGQMLDAQLAGVRWAMNAHEDESVPIWDEDVDGVTLGGLTGREFGMLENDLTADENAGTGTSRQLLVADGTVDAPYVDESMSDAERVGAVGRLPYNYLKWAESRVNQLTGTGGGDEGNGGKRFADFLADAQTTPTSTEQQSTDTPAPSPSTEE